MLRGNPPLFCVIVLLAVGFATQTAKADFVGVVYSEGSNQRVVHASVRLCTAGGVPMAEAFTTDRGEFAFTVSDGTYILKITADGFTPLEMEVTADFHSSVGNGISIFLRPAGKSAGQAPGGSPISAHELSMPASARKLVDSGKKKLYADQNPEAALRDFQSAVAKAPDYYEAYYQVGMVYLSLKNLADAEANLKKSVELSNQSYAEAMLALAILQLGNHQATDGEPLLRRGLALNPNSWAGQYELGKLELYRMHIDAALEAARKAEALAPDQPKVYRLLSLIHLRQEDYQAAVADLDAYIKLDPNSPDGQTAKQIRADTMRKLDNSHP